MRDCLDDGYADRWHKRLQLYPSKKCLSQGVAAGAFRPHPTVLGMPGKSIERRLSEVFAMYDEAIQAYCRVTGAKGCDQRASFGLLGVRRPDIYERIMTLSISSPQNVDTSQLETFGLRSLQTGEISAKRSSKPPQPSKPSKEND